MRLLPTTIAPCLIAALATCTAVQHEGSDASPQHEPEPAGVADPLAAFSSTEPGELGDVVQDLADDLWIVFQDKQNTYWFGSNSKGVYRVDGQDIVRYTTKDGLCNDSIRQILEDGSGNVYFNTCGGISKFDGQRFSTLVPIESSTSVSEWKLEPGDLWFQGNQNDNGPYRYDGQSLYHLEFPKHDMEDGFNSMFPGVPPYSPYQVYTVHKDSRGHVWFGTSTFGACRYDGKSLTWFSDKELVEVDAGPSFGVRGIIEDREGKLWLSNTLHRYDVDPTAAAGQEDTAAGYTREPGLVDPGAQSKPEYTYFTSGLRDNQGALWMATYGAGVWRYDGNRMTHYPLQEAGHAVLLYSIYEDNQGVLWLGTLEAGAYRFNGETFEPFRPFQ
jgi:streptogramin lyase